jgi:ribosomal protein S18 acetylase RimI-like enzyme
MALFKQEADFKPDFEAQRNGVFQIIENSASGRIFVIEKEHQVIGALSLLFTISTALGGKVALLEDFIVDTNFRGQGYGTQLLNKALHHAQACNCLRVLLLTDGDNLKAQSIYQQAGFVESGMKPMRLIF